MFFTVLEILLRVRDALTPLLIAVMVMGIAAAVIALCREQRFLTGPLGRFRALTPMGRVAVVVLLCLLTRWAGSKPEGASPSGSAKASSSPLPRHSEPTQDNAGNSPVSNLVVTAFKVEGQGVSFETAWPGDLLDRALSRDIHLFASTNLLERKWTCLCAVPLPSHTNSFTFTVTANDVAASVRQRFLDTFGGRGFYTFVLDFDSDGDGLPDWRERVLGLDPADPSDAFRDDDGDGLVNLHECWAGCDPFTPDGSNTLLSVMARSVDDRIAGREPAISLPLYSNYESAGSAYDLTVNTNCWAYGIDFSCCSMWNSYDKHRGHAATAISPCHIVFAEHFKTPVGTTYFFKGTNNVIYSSMLTRKVQILNSDIEIGLLGSPLPGAVVPARILPENYRSYLGTARGLPVVTLDQEEKALVMELAALPARRKTDGNENVQCQEAHTAARRAFCEEMVDGDSSNPRFLVVGNKLVLLHAMYLGGYGYGPLLTLYKNEIQAAMDSLCLDGDYRLIEFDFSDYAAEPLSWEDL